MRPAIALIPFLAALIAAHPARAAGFCDIEYVRSLLKENMEILERMDKAGNEKEKPIPAAAGRQAEADFGQTVERLLKNDMKIYACVLLGHFKDKVWKDVFGE